MARQLLLYDALGSPDFTQFVAMINADLAGLLSSYIGSFEALVIQPYPQYAQQVKLAIDTDTGGKTITHPYQVQAFQADTDLDLLQMVNLYRAANPGFFWGPLVYIYNSTTASAQFRSIAILLYNQSLMDGQANWNPGFAGGGGSSGGVSALIGLGDMSTTSFIVTHGLISQTIQVAVTDMFSGRPIATPDWSYATQNPLNAIMINFPIPPLLNQYLVTIK